MLVFAIADRLLDVIGMATIIYFTVRGTTKVLSWWYSRKKG